jgi:TPR repeat protein
LLSPANLFRFDFVSIRLAVACARTGPLVFNANSPAPQSLSKAAQWHRKSADHGNSFAQNNLARMLLRGCGVPQEPMQSLDLFAVQQPNATPAGRTL